MRTVPTLEDRFIRADEKLRAALAELDALRTGVTNAYQHGALTQKPGSLALVPDVTRNLSIAFTECEGAVLRLDQARSRFNAVKGR